MKDGIKIANSTNVPNEVIEEVIAAVCPRGVVGFHVTVRNSKRSASGLARYHRNAVSLRLNRSDSYRELWRWNQRATAGQVRSGARMKRGGDGNRGDRGYLPMSIGSRIECLIMLAAHELRHLWQVKYPTAPRVWGSRGRFSERDADAYALQWIRSYRRGEWTIKSLAPARAPAKVPAPKPAPVVLPPAPAPEPARVLPLFPAALTSDRLVGAIVTAGKMWKVQGRARVAPGATVIQLAAALGVSVGTVKRALRAHPGVKVVGQVAKRRGRPAKVYAVIPHA